jgi:hypothetical protein
MLAMNLPHDRVVVCAYMSLSSYFSNFPLDERCRPFDMKRSLKSGKSEASSTGTMNCQALLLDRSYTEQISFS